jgi:predicted amidophosphoribosyltransferase
MELIAERLRACTNCGFLFIKPELLLCSACETLCNNDFSTKPFHRFRKTKKTTMQAGLSKDWSRIQGYCIWDWIPGKNEALSALLSTMKGGMQKKAFLFYAQTLLQKRLTLGHTNIQNLVFIPAPASRSGEKDHAWMLARSLSTLTGTEVFNVFIKKSETHQRGLSRNDRAKLSMEFNEKFSKELINESIGGKTVVFVDDVVTTGSTAMKAKGLLLNFKNFEVWCLAQRETCALATPLI